MYQDGALNSAVDVLYIDITSSYKFIPYIEELVSENTIVIFKIKTPTETLIPNFFTEKYEHCYRFGDWDKEPHLESEYFMMLL